jgi:hypothetical protein
MRSFFVKAIMAAGVAAVSFAAVSLADAPGARAQDAGGDGMVWKTVGEWQIGVNKPLLGYGCYMRTTYSRGTTLALGFNKKLGNGFIMFRNSAWRSIEQGKDYPIEFRFNDGTFWRGPGVGVEGDTPGVYLPIDRPNFMVDFAKKLSVAISTSGRGVTQLPLTGTYAAVREVALCQGAVNVRTGDPFEAGGRPYGGDPFR